MGSSAALASADDPRAQAEPKPWTAHRWTSTLQRILIPILKASLTQSEDGESLLLDMADPTGANGQRTFLITITEV